MTAHVMFRSHSRSCAVLCGLVLTTTLTTVHGSSRSDAAHRSLSGLHGRLLLDDVDETEQANEMDADGAPAGGAGCTPSPLAGFDCQLPLLQGDMTLHITTPAAEDTSVSFAVESVGSGWVSLAWADPANSQAMIGATAVIGRMDGDAASVDVYDLNGKSASGVVLASTASPRVFTITDTSLERDAGGTRMLFTRALDDAFTASDPAPYLAAFHADSDSLAYHGGDVTQLMLAPRTADVEGGSEASIKDLSTEYKWHGWLQVSGWGVCIPIAILFGRRLKDIGPMWLHVHRALNTVGLLAGTAGIIIAVTQFQESSGSVYNFHKAVGVLVIVLGWLQAIAGMARPKAPADGESATTLRTVFLWAHRALGYLAVVLAQIVIFYGLKLYHDSHPISLNGWRGGYAGWLALLVAVGIALELRRCFVVPKKHDKLLKTADKAETPHAAGHDL